jgi:hypothetical protein
MVARLAAVCVIVRAGHYQPYRNSPVGSSESSENSSHSRVPQQVGRGNVF